MDKQNTITMFPSNNPDLMSEAYFYLFGLRLKVNIQVINVSVMCRQSTLSWQFQTQNFSLQLLGILPVQATLESDQFLQVCEFKTRHEKTNILHIMGKQKAQISFVINAKLISTFVFATRIA